MMIVKGNDFTYILAISNVPTILISDNSKQIIECLNSYFVQKKKSKCIIYEDDNLIMKNDDINFIYISDEMPLISNMELKQKSIMNFELANIIKENQEKFASIEQMRSSLNGLLSDNGMYRLKNILSRGLNKIIDISIASFNIEDIISMLKIDDNDKLKDDEKIVVILNMMLYVNRNKTNLVYLDCEITGLIENYISKSESNNYYVIDNEKITKLNNKYNLMISSNSEEIEVIIEDNTENIKYISLANHKLIKDNIDLLDNKNIRKYIYLKNNNRSFLIKSIY